MSRWLSVVTPRARLTSYGIGMCMCMSRRVQGAFQNPTNKGHETGKTRGSSQIWSDVLIVVDA